VPLAYAVFKSAWALPHRDSIEHIEKEHNSFLQMALLSQKIGLNKAVIHSHKTAFLSNNQPYFRGVNNYLRERAKHNKSKSGLLTSHTDTL